MKKLLTFVVIAFIAQYAWNDLGLRERLAPAAGNADRMLSQAFNQRQSDLQVQGSGEVVRVLADDTEGSRHQRFILRLSSGQTILVAHNIDLAPRVSSIRPGDAVEFCGEYEWNARGGVIHWTHHDPRGAHVSGWLKHRGQTYR